ncbi:MAG: hypothetical protein HeimC2_00480 [Candidatus Heimdallarchaeota archaeon LC_2]|nr:MAG: hypothetical protein HeimC2_00480 [Candidatus Heimdallarchaeota archaeon LC_2]
MGIKPKTCFLKKLICVHGRNTVVVSKTALLIDNLIHAQVEKWNSHSG